HVAKIVVPSQDIMSEERAQFCEDLSFSPWHGLPAHKPLGLVNRVRRRAYVEISQLRHGLNGRPTKQPPRHPPAPSWLSPFGRCVSGNFPDFRGVVAMAKAASIKIKLVSSADTGYYYVAKKNSRTMTDKLVKKKYDPVAKKHVEFRESKIK